MKVWITKYALSHGIWTGEVNEPTDSGTIECKRPMTPKGGKELLFGYFHGEGREWHRTEEAAKTKALEMRDKKVLSLLKKIRKLEAMKF